MPALAQLNPHDAFALPEDELSVPGVPPVPLRDGQGQRRGLHRADGHHPAFSLGDNLLGNYQHVASINPGPLILASVYNLGRQIVPSLGFRHTFNTNDANFRRHSYVASLVIGTSIPSPPALCYNCNLPVGSSGSRPRR